MIRTDIGEGDPMEVTTGVNGSASTNETGIGVPAWYPVWLYWYNHYIEIADLLAYYCDPLIMFIGLFGNILSVILMRRGSFRKMSSGVYLLFLSASDLSFNLLNFSVWLPGIAMDFYIGSFDVMCKLIVYIEKICVQTSSWMIVAVTLERAIAVALPHRAKVISTRKKAWVVSCVITAFVSLLNIYQLFIMGVVEDGGCFFTDEFNDKLEGIAFAVTDLLMYSLGPSIILIACNCVLVTKLKESQKFRASVGSGDAVDNDTTKIVMMVVIISCAFVVFTVPHSCFIISDFIPAEYLWLPTTRELWFTICLSLLGVNHSINFFLYFMTGPKFRKEFWSLLKCNRLANNMPKDQDNSTSSRTVSTVT